MYTESTGRNESPTTTADRPTWTRLLGAAVENCDAADDADAVASVVVDVVDRAFDGALVGVFCWRPSIGRLEPTAHSAAAGDAFESVPEFDDGPEWEAFVEGRTRVLDPPATEPGPSENRFRCELVVPMGVHGVVLAGYTDRSGFTEAEGAFLDAVAAAARSRLDALDVAADRDAVTDRLRDAERERDGVEGTHASFRGLVESVLDAEGRTGIEDALGDALVALSGVDAATIVAGADEPPIEVVRTYGDPGLAAAYEDADGTTPAVRASIDRAVRAVPRVASAGGDATWRTRVLSAGYRGATALPLVRGGRTFGVAEVFATDAETLPSTDLLAAMAALAADGLATLERRESLLAGRDVELELGVDEPSAPLFVLARAADEPLALVESVHGPDGSRRLYVESSVPLPVDDLREEAEILEVDPVDETADRAVYRVTFAAPGVAEVLAERGAALVRVVPTGTDQRLVVRVAPSVDVRQFLADCADVEPGISLRRRTPVADDAPVASGLSRFDGLTDRQREVLYRAYREGFFAWPRDRDGDELADDFDIAPSTFHQHLRKALDAVLGEIVD